MRIVFLGTPEFAVPSLQALVSAGHRVLAVFTQPDRAKGRGNQIAESPVKMAAKALALPVHQPERIRRAEPVEQLQQLAPDLMVVVGYGQIIPQTIIDIPPNGILNVHASLLPKYRGAAPIQWAIANGETETGVTIMQIDAGLDTGDMLRKAVTPVQPDETAPELSARLAPLGADLLVGTITEIQQGSAVREKQDDSQATLAPILKREDGLIDWSRTASDIYNRLRGFTPWPGAYTFLRGQQLNITKARPSQGETTVSGVVRIQGRRVIVGCGGRSALELLEVQLAGRKRMSAEAFINGYQLADNEVLGSRN
jgi:methionyl-tRNA formyltransferase